MKNQSSRVKIAVQDTGSGIKSEHFPNLFKLFGKLEQEDKSVNTGGVGLGLAISQTLVKLINNNQSEIKVKSTVGLGSKFSFCIYQSHPR